MQDKVFIDSNVLIYAYSEDEPEKKDISLNTLDGSNITLSTQVINEFIWIMNRKSRCGIREVENIDRYALAEI